jgi:UDP-glucose 4-epimerase
MSVIGMIYCYQKIFEGQIFFKIVGRRTGDIASCNTKVDRAKNLLNWVVKKSSRYVL